MRPTVFNTLFCFALACLNISTSETISIPASNNFAAVTSSPRFVAFASTWNADYSFYIPLTARVWKRLGFEPIVAIIGDGTKTRVNSIIRNYTSNWAGTPLVKLGFIEGSGAKIIEVDFDDLSLYASMVGRLFLPCDSTLPSAAEMLITDVDMWAFDNRLWETRNNSLPAHYYGFMMVIFLFPVRRSNSHAT